MIGTISPKVLFWFFSCVVWWLFELWLNRKKRAPDYSQELDDGTLKTLEWTNSASVIIALGFAYFLDWPIFNLELIFLPGLILLVTGLIFRALIVHSMGKNFTVDISIQDNHQLNTKGWYKHIRHPSYSALYLSFIGLAISLNNLIATDLLLIPTLLALLHRIKQEEKVLIQKFNNQYWDYRSKTYALIPFIF